MEDSSAPRVSRLVIQQNHGFTRGSVIRFDGDDWVLGVAGESGLGVVGSIPDAGKFEFVHLGFLDGLDAYDLIPGTTYYVSKTAPGELSTELSDSPIFNANTATTGFVITGSGAPAATGNSTGVTAADLATAIATEIMRANTTYSLLTHTHAFPSPPIRTVTIDTAATGTDSTILVDATAAPVTITLPVVSTTAGQIITIKKIDSSANAVTIAVPDAALIDGTATQSLVTQYTAFSMQTDSSNWYIVYRNPAPSLLL